MVPGVEPRGQGPRALIAEPIDGGGGDGAGRDPPPQLTGDDGAARSVYDGDFARGFGGGDGERVRQAAGAGLLLLLLLRHAHCFR